MELVFARETVNKTRKKGDFRSCNTVKEKVRSVIPFIARGNLGWSNITAGKSLAFYAANPGSILSILYDSLSITTSYS